MLLTLALLCADVQDVTETHREAERHLRAGIEAAHVPGLAEERHFPLLLEAGRAAAETLGDLYAGRVAAQLVEDARWRAVFDRAEAERRLEPALEELADDLGFRPRMEADLPLGFPEPTPVLAIELRSYPSYRMARTSMSRRENGAFWTLFQHIQSNEIAMTAPVEMAYDEDSPAAGWMAFLYDVPSRGPVGTEGDVDVVDVPAARYASLGCRGVVTRERVEAAREQLLRWARSRGLRVTEEVRTLSYNGPSVPLDQRYYEIQLRVLPRDV